MAERIDNYYRASLNDATVWPALTDDLDVDAAIVGGGISGVALAVELAERGRRVALLEANRIGWGATGRNGGQVTGSLSGDRAMQKQLANTLGSEAERFVNRLRWRGHEIIESRIARYGIDCDIAYGHLFTAWTRSHQAALNAAMHQAEQAGIGDRVSLLSQHELHERLDTPLYHGAVYNRRNFHLHSLNLCVGEARAAASLGVSIHEQSPVLGFDHNGKRVTLQLRTAQVHCDTLILAGNAYHRLARRQLGGYLFPATLGNLTTEVLPSDTRQRLNPGNLAVYDSRTVLDYYRFTADGRLMFGSGTSYLNKPQATSAECLRPALERVFPTLKGVRIDKAWSGQAGIVLNRIPMIGRLSPDVYYLQGYSGHGIATSHIAAEVIAEAITGTEERFDLFRDLRHIRLPLGQRAGNALLALGMWYYRLRESLAG